MPYGDARRKRVKEMSNEQMELLTVNRYFLEYN